MGRVGHASLDASILPSLTTMCRTDLDGWVGVDFDRFNQSMDSIHGSIWWCESAFRIRQPSISGSTCPTPIEMRLIAPHPTHIPHIKHTDRLEGKGPSTSQPASHGVDKRAPWRA